MRHRFEIAEVLAGLSISQHVCFRELETKPKSWPLKYSTVTPHSKSAKSPFRMPTFHRPSSTIIASLSSFTTCGTAVFERHVWMCHSRMVKSLLPLQAFRLGKSCRMTSSSSWPVVRRLQQHVVAVCCSGLLFNLRREVFLIRLHMGGFTKAYLWICPKNTTSPRPLSCASLSPKLSSQAKQVTPPVWPPVKVPFGSFLTAKKRAE